MTSARQPLDILQKFLKYANDEDTNMDDNSFGRELTRLIEIGCECQGEYLAGRLVCEISCPAKKMGELESMDALCNMMRELRASHSSTPEPEPEP